MKTGFLLFGEIDPEYVSHFYQWLPYRGDGSLIISSCGGDVGLMIALYDAIIENDIPTVGVGILQSAAAVLFQAGSKRSMYPNAMLMFHEMERDKTTDDMPDREWYLQTKMAGMICQRTGMTKPEAHDLFDGKFIETPRAIELGLCDEMLNGG